MLTAFRGPLPLRCDALTAQGILSHKTPSSRFAKFTEVVQADVKFALRRITSFSGAAQSSQKIGAAPAPAKPARTTAAGFAFPAYPSDAIAGASTHRERPIVAVLPENKSASLPGS